MSERWITLEVERALYVARGRDTILCTDSNHRGRVTIVVKMTDEAIRRAFEREDHYR